MSSSKTPDDSGETGGDSDWIWRVDEALTRGETPPEFTGKVPEGSSPSEPARVRALLEQIYRASNLGEPGSSIAPSEEQSTCNEEDWPDHPSTIPSAIGRFRLEEILGRGGFGVVFRAFDPEMDRFVALKIPKADPLLSPEIRRRFLREARAAARLDHPNLVPVYEAGEAGSACYIASAYCEGPTLRRWIDRGNVPLDPRASARMALALARAIDYVHGKGILHCDLKPGNILLDLLDDPGTDPVPRVTDFGLARLAESPLSESTASKPWGTPPYMAPEQIAQLRDSIGPPTDIYAIGAILYELLTGQPPHQEKTLWKLLRAVTADPPTPPRKRLGTIPQDLDAIVMKCLEKRPDRRYSSAKEFADDLERFLDHRPTRARPLGPLRRSARWAVRYPTSAVALVAGLSAALIVVSYAVVLGQINEELSRANASARAALKSERRHLYSATLALAQQDDQMGRLGPGQTRLRSLIPGPGSNDDDLRGFSWYYLDRQLRRNRTILDNLGPGYDCWVSASAGLVLGNNGQEVGVWSLPHPAPADQPTFGPARPVYEFRRIDALSGRIAGSSKAALSPDGRLSAFVTGTNHDALELTLINVHDGQILKTFPFLDDQPIQTPHFLEGGETIGLSTGPFRARLPTDRLRRHRINLGIGKSINLLMIPGAPRYMASPTGSGRLCTFQLAFLPGGALFEIWDLSSGRVIDGFEGAFTAMADSPIPGGPIALGTTDGTIQFREPRSGRLLDAWEVSDEEIFSVTFSPDGKKLLSGGDRVANLWEVDSGRLLDSIDSLSGWLRSAAFLPGSTEIALGTNAGLVEIWHPEPVSEQIILNGHTDEVWGVAFSPDGTVIASVGGDRTVIVRDARTGGILRTMSGHEEWPSALAFHPDGTRVVTADFGGNLRVWNVNSGTLERSIKVLDDRIRSLAFSPDGRLLAIGGRNLAVQLRDTRDWSLMDEVSSPHHSGQVRGLAFSPDGQSLVTAADVSLLLWELQSTQSRVRWSSLTQMTCVAFSPDGSLIASGDDRRGVTIRETADGTIRFSLPGLHREEISAVTFSPDGRTLAVAGQDRVITLVDLETGSHHLTLSGHEGGINALAFSPDGRTLASASHDRTVRLWWAGPGPPLDGQAPQTK